MSEVAKEGTSTMIPGNEAFRVAAEISFYCRTGARSASGCLNAEAQGEWLDERIDLASTDTTIHMVQFLGKYF